MNAPGLHRRQAQNGCVAAWKLAALMGDPARDAGWASPVIVGAAAGALFLRASWMVEYPGNSGLVFRDGPARMGS